jgi:cytochrome P450
MSRRSPPTLRYLSPLHFYADLRRDPLRFLSEAAILGNVVRLKAGIGEAWLLTHPADIRHILQDRSSNYRNNEWLAQIFQLGGGDGLLSTEGELSRRQRRLLQPAFHRDRIFESATVMTVETESMIARWKGNEVSGEPLDASRELVRLMLKITARTFCGTDPGEVVDKLADSLIDGFRYFNYRLLHAFPISPRIPTRRNRRFAAASRTVEKIVAMMIDERRRREVRSADLLEPLLDTESASQEPPMGDRQIRDTIVTFLSAGTETTATALAWTWFLIASNPESEHRLHDELREKLGSRSPTVYDLPALDYTTRLVKEALRIYPPAWMMMRTSVDQDELGGFRIPRGTAVLMSPYLTQRRADLWDDPLRFDPDRFTPESSMGHMAYAYFPFGGGARRCIGENFALVAMTLVLATIAQRYRVRLWPGHPVVPHVLFTLRPRDGLMVTVEPR